MITKPTYWTEARITLALKDMLDTLQAEKDPKKWYLTLHELCVSFNVHRQRLPEWLKEYKDIPEIADSIIMIENILESRLNGGALRNQINAYQAIFNLKNNFGWKDEQDIHDTRVDRQNDELTEIRNRLSSRTNKNIRNKKNAK